jgi:hypothetical protein
MSRNVARVSLLGLFLIAFGLLILLKKFHVIDLHTAEVIWPLIALMGLFITGRGLIDNRKGKIIGGTVLFLYSIFFLLRSMNAFSVPIDMIVPASFLIFGIVLVMLFVNKPAEWYFLVPGLLLLALGSSMMLTEYGYWYGWEVREFIRTWWPAALVLVGAGMILRHRSGRTPGNEWRQGPPSSDPSTPPADTAGERSTPTGE